MIHTKYKTIAVLILLAAVTCLTTGIDQVLHILACHTTANGHHSEENEHSHPDQKHCQLCQYFVSGQNQSVTCHYLPVSFDTIALWTISVYTFEFTTTVISTKISRAPPAV